MQRQLQQQSEAGSRHVARDAKIGGPKQMRTRETRAHTYAPTAPGKALWRRHAAIPQSTAQAYTKIVAAATHGQCRAHKQLAKASKASCTAARTLQLAERTRQQ